MKRTIISIVLVIGSALVASAQEIKSDNPPKTLADTLKSAGNFNTLLSLLESVNLNDLGVASSDGKTIPGTTSDAMPATVPRVTGSRMTTSL